jgi:hypothetical protein
VVDLSKEIRSSLNPISSSTVQSVRQAGMTVGQEQMVREGVRRALQCGRVPPRTARPRSGEDCTAEVVLYDVVCSEQVAFCWLFRAGAYESAQNKLRTLLARRPPSQDQHLERADWCWDVLSTVAEALDATNVRPEFFNTVGVDERYNAPPSQAGHHLFTRVNAFMQRLADGLAPHAESMGNAPVLPPLVPSMGGNTFSDPASKRPLFPTNGSSMPWYVPRAFTLPEGHLPQLGPIVTNTMHSVYGTDRDAQYFKTRPKEYLKYLFVHHRAESVAPGQFRHKRSMASNADWARGYVMTGDAYMDYCAAWAQDIINTTLERFVAVGLLEWLRQMTPFYHNGMLDPEFPYDDLAAQMTAQARATAQAETGAIYGAMGTVAAMIPVIGWLVALVLAVVQLIVQFILMFADMAAGWDCPLLPFKRSVASGECAITTVRSTEEVDIVMQQRLLALAAVTGMESMRQFERPQAPELPPPVMPPIGDLINTEPEPVPWGTIAIAGGAIVGGALLLRFLRR